MVRFPKTLRIWDDLLSKGQRVVAVGGSDAHARHMSLGPLHKTIFPYEYHFSTINTHVLTPTPLTGNLVQDRKMVFERLGCRPLFYRLRSAGSYTRIPFLGTRKEFKRYHGRENRHGWSGDFARKISFQRRDQINQRWQMYQDITWRDIHAYYK